MLKKQYKDMERLSMVANMSEKCSLIFYGDMNYRCGKKSYTEGCSGKEKSGIAWSLAGLWKLRGIRKTDRRKMSIMCR
jgi:hypothetical protein